MNRQNGATNSLKASQIDRATIGKIPPQAIDAEQAILGAIMLEKDAFDDALEILIPECFYSNAHQEIFKAMIQVNSRSGNLDITTVCNELEKAGFLEMVGGRYYVTTLTNSVVNSTATKDHCRIVFERFLLREIIRIGHDMIASGYDSSTDAFELLDESEEKLTSLGVKHLHGEMIPIDTALYHAFKQVQEWRKMDSSITGVPSGYSRLDKATRGWQKGDLIIMAARPSKGKTAFALNLVINAAGNKLRPTPTAMWSLEMKYLYLVLRMLAKESKINLHNIQTGMLSEEMMKRLYEKGIQALAKHKIFFDDHSSLSMMHLKARARRLKKKGQLGLIVVDYLQLMTGTGKGNREQEISAISRELKNLAVELDIPIIALSQLSREVEKRKDARPILSDLRESGAIEQDADVVLFLWGPTDDEIRDDPKLQYRRYVRIAKQRNGSLIQCDFDFHDEIQFFEMIEGQNLIPFHVAEDRAKDFSERQVNDKNPDLPF